MLLVAQGRPEQTGTNGVVILPGHGLRNPVATCSRQSPTCFYTRMYRRQAFASAPTVRLVAASGLLQGPCDCHIARLGVLLTVHWLSVETLERMVSLYTLGTGFAAIECVPALHGSPCSIVLEGLSWTMPRSRHCAVVRAGHPQACGTHTAACRSGHQLNGVTTACVASIHSDELCGAALQCNLL